MMNENTNNQSNRLGGVLAAFAVGAVIGGGIALLYAPRSGKETRKLLADKSRDLKGYFGEKKSELSVAIEAGRNAMHEERVKHQRIA